MTKDSKVCFAHNVTFRKDPLIRTISIEKEHFPTAEFYVSGDGDPMIFSKEWDINFEIYGPPQGHKVGCVNGTLHALRMACESNADIICFSHDDVYIHNIDRIRECIEMIGQGYDFVGRRHRGVHSHSPYTSSQYCDKYIMLESFIMSAPLAQKLIKNEKMFDANAPSLLPHDIRNSPSCELAFGEMIFSHSEKMYLYDFIHNWQDQENEMGYVHVGNPRGWV